MPWFKRTKKNIETQEKKELGEGNWIKCPNCDEILHRKQWEQNLYVCTKCDHHFRIGSEEYFHILFDDGEYKEFDKKVRSLDPLEFSDTKKYSERIEESIKKTGLYDAIRNAYGRVHGKECVISAMDFTFIGGSMGSVVGEKIARAVQRAMKEKCPYIIISKSGGARMMEAAISLMQLAKTAAWLAKLAEQKLPYISVLTDPTTGGASASFAMLGDVNIAEPGALIGFAGPRVVRQATGKDLPKGFQRAEFVLEHGFLDMVVHRKDLKDKLYHLMKFMHN
ncbi:MAG: acetyl-CoA carboxylase, carboxyltransferase subunit beta [Ignavibacteria bacterium]|nr:acetyl-CoA carboxylase, carboxyltransferase subunit beta [Ignavibacteria bacterium]